MMRACFTVEMKDGRAFDANHLAVTMCCSPAPGGGQESMLSFVCSGQQMIVLAGDVKDVRYHPTGASHCSECDGSLYPLVGAGIHANPPPFGG